MNVEQEIRFKTVGSVVCALILTLMMLGYGRMGLLIAGGVGTVGLTVALFRLARGYRKL